ncbi:MAG: hypothetical protein HY824_12755 [Acidobacteria bacterium]|nr:hypothetical protein [Acidobacteriota bacterium]
MEALVVPAPVRRKLGDDGSEGLVEMFGLSHQLASDRFERRLVEEIAGVRVEMHQGFGVLRQEMASLRVEWLKWSFLFWIGHVGITLGVVAYMIR